MHVERVGRQHRVRRGQGHQHVSGEIRTTLVDHVLINGFIMAGAGKKVLNVGRSTMSSIIQTFCRPNRYVKQQRIHPHAHTELLYVSLIQWHFLTGVARAPFLCLSGGSYLHHGHSK